MVKNVFLENVICQRDSLIPFRASRSQIALVLASSFTKPFFLIKRGHIRVYQQLPHPAHL